MPSYRETFSEYRDRFESESHFLHVVLPSVVRPGEPFDAQAVMMDARGMPEEGWAGRVGLRPNDPALRTPECVEFAPEDLGRKTIEGLVAEEPGGYYLRTEPPDCPGAAPVSTPTLCREQGPRLYWGDIHFHTVVGNCHPDWCKSPDFGYWYARNVALLDFAAATDHLRGIHRIDGNWDVIRRSAREWSCPGEFVTFLAFESSHAIGYGGDNNIYYRDGDADYFWVDREDMKGVSPRVSLDRLWGWLDRQGAPYLSIPHHTGRAGKYRDFEDPYHNPDRETVLEVFSWWGSSQARHDDLYLLRGKTDARAYWQDALKLGYRYGVIGSSDTHHTMPGTPFPTNPDNYHYAHMRLNCQGLAGIYAEKLERGALFDALLQRQCFATTWWRPIVELSVSGVPMGRQAVADADARGPRRIQATVVSSKPGSVELLRNNEVIERERMEAGLNELSFLDEEPLEKLVIRDAPKADEPFAFYHLKAHWNCQIAWSSPVWLTL
ncbi:MAG: hypothetical protein PVJ27_01530 [Candidatus Brocadiaceae bacterium]|jgi:hypothetical protein